MCALYFLPTLLPSTKSFHLPCSRTVKTPDLDTFTRVLLTLPDGARVPIRYILPYAQHVERVAVITIERTWFAGERYELDESTGCWRCTTLPPPPLPPPPVPQEVSFAVAGPHAVRAITPSIVRVFFDIPYQVHLCCA